MMRVLVVSEDPMERLRAASALRLHEGAEVVEVASGDEARALLLSEGDAFDVLVVDGDLHPRGGFALLYDLRARAELGDLAVAPAVVLVAREQDRWLAGWAGANEVMPKPVDTFELARRVAALDGTAPAPYGDANATSAQVAAAIAGHTSG